MFPAAMLSRSEGEDEGVGSIVPSRKMKIGGNEQWWIFYFLSFLVEFFLFFDFLFFLFFFCFSFLKLEKEKERD